MNIKKGFILIVSICALASFAQNASAQNSQTDEAPVASEVNKADKKSSESKKKDDFVDRLMEKIPYSQSLKYTWDVVDGDVDLYFKDLRVDRRNKGLSYTVNSLPMIGEMNGSELRADVGEESKLTFKSDYVPFVGHVDGFQFKASTGTDDSNISLRYKIDITWK
jgi:hypothetical protein